MADQVTNKTGKSGQTSNDRRILSGITTTTAAPSSKNDGFLTNRSRYLHLLFRVAGVSPAFLVQIWWYSDISGQWHRGEVITVNSPDIVTLETQGLLRIALQVTQINGTSPVLDAWLALVKET